MDKTMYFGGVEGWLIETVAGLACLSMSQRTRDDTSLHFNLIDIRVLTGATHSNLVICDQQGRVVGRSTGPGTNHWSLGIEQCAQRLVDMLHAGKRDAGLPIDRPLDSLGLTLSGCEQESTNEALAARLKEKDERCARAVYVASDTTGSLFTGAPRGGMVLIAGTGSNGLLRTAAGRQYGCGGWGHFLGDEGSAYWIAHRAVKTIFDDEDGLRPAEHPTARAWDAVREHFHVTSRAELLPHVYQHFDKAQFAGLTSKLSKLAYAGDALCQHLFAAAGAALGAHAAALVGRAGAAGEVAGDSMRVVCVGSVWKSWSLMKPGALRQLDCRGVKIKLEFVHLLVSSAVGAAGLAAQNVHFALPRDDAACCRVFYTYCPGDSDLNKLNGHSKENGVVGCGCCDWSYWS